MTKATSAATPIARPLPESKANPAAQSGMASGPMSASCSERNASGPKSLDCATGCASVYATDGHPFAICQIRFGKKDQAGEQDPQPWPGCAQLPAQWGHYDSDRRVLR